MKIFPSCGTLNLPVLVLARACTATVFMTYPACLAALQDTWRMTATEAGLIQGMFMGAFALSLLITSPLCDRIGARRVFLLTSAATALTAGIFAVFTTSYPVALITMTLMGFAQGATYTPAIILVSVNAEPATKNAALGWVLAGMSGGYVLSMILALALLSTYGYRAAFAGTAAFTVLGWGLAWASARRAADSLAPADAPSPAPTPASNRRVRLLTVGYIGHTWETLGMWAWMPAFLSMALLTDGGISAVELGFWTAMALHVTGVISSFVSGHAADRLGVRTVLVFFAALGFLCSASIGWLPALPAAALFVFVAVYGFATTGDSAVLSSAMTDAVPLQRLGKVLGVRSILGIGAGAVAPVAFGMALDAFPGQLGWAIAFSTLAGGGLVALVCAWCLEKNPRT